MTAVATAPTQEPAPDKEEQPLVAGPTSRRTGLKLLIIAVVWGLGYALFKNVDTLYRPFVQLNGLDTWLNTVRDHIQASTQTNWFFHGVIGNGSTWINARFLQLQNLLSQPCCGRPVPKIGWLGVTAIFGWLALALAGFRYALLVILGTLSFGILGYWQESVDTVMMVIIAVIVSIVIGVPTGIAMSRRKWVSQVITPVLDVMQTMPSFAYIPFFVVIFGVGLTCAVVVTIVYAIPPLVRITEHGLHTVSETTVEAAGSMGLTKRQMLRKVQLPMARRTIIVGVNQCTLAALSMVVLTGFIDGPGLGSPILESLANLNVGEAAVPGLLIVIIAIVLDRTTTAASERREATQGRTASVSGPGVMLTTVVLEKLPRWASEETRTRRLPTPALRRTILAVTLVGVVICIWLSQTYLDLAQFPSSLTVGPHLVDAINSFSNWVIEQIGTYTEDFKNFITYTFLNPLQELLANTPWWLMAPVLMAISWVLGGLKPFLTTTVGSAIILLIGLWNVAMITLASTLVATMLVMILAIVLGVWIGRSRKADLFLRPILDALQTFPPFIYLIPALILFAPSRFTAIVAAVLYAFPISVKLVADGIRGVSGPTVEAAQASGVTRWQMIFKVQLPMSRSAIALAANQGLLYVLSMVVIGALVGAGGLGYLVVSGFSQDNLFGKGLAAGVTLAVLGIMLDRTARGAANRGHS